AQRIKEISIRKILGASAIEIMALLSKGFMKLIIISILISLPIAYYIMNNWLQNYDMRTSLSWWLFTGAAFFALLISMLTVSWQTFSASRANPVDALKYE
ncbi:MAG: FtsX-like permease family protein, partial [Chitinophagaceae bacterium]